MLEDSFNSIFDLFSSIDKKLKSPEKVAKEIEDEFLKQKMETMYLSHLIFMMAILKPMDSKAKDVVAYFAVQVVNGVIIHALLHCVIYAKEYIKNVY